MNDTFEMGRKGEKIAREIILKYVNPDMLTQIDWAYKKDGKWYSIEVKYKSELFKPPPFYGHGLDKKQIEKRLAFYHDTGIRCLLIIIDQTSNIVYYNWLDILEAGNHFDTKNDIRVYDINNFIKKPLNEH
jgi:hypothetical protein